MEKTNEMMNILEGNSVKPLTEMTLEELWKLFPIFLVEHNEKWVKDKNMNG